MLVISSIVYYAIQRLLSYMARSERESKAVIDSKTTKRSSIVKPACHGFYDISKYQCKISAPFHLILF